MATKLEISRIQNRRGLRRDLPQPLNPGELGLCIDTAQIFIGASNDLDLLAVPPGMELYRPAPAGGQTTANKLLRRVLLGETNPIKTSVADSSLEDDGSPVLSFTVIKDAILGKGVYAVQGMYNTDEVGNGAYNIDIDASALYDTVEFEDLTPDSMTGWHAYRVYVGVYEHDLDEIEIEISYPRNAATPDLPEGYDPPLVPGAKAEVRLNLLNTRFDPTNAIEPGESGVYTREQLDAMIFLYSNVKSDYGSRPRLDSESNTAAYGSFNDGQLTDATWNNMALNVRQYGNIAWCMNQIYKLSDKGLVVSTNNIQILTDLSLANLINPDLNIIRHYVRIAQGVSNLNSQDFFLDLSADRAFKFNYSLSVNSFDGIEVTEEKIGEGSIDISVMVDRVDASKSRLTFRDEQSVMDDTLDVKLVPYLGDSPLASGQIAVLFQTMNYSGKEVDMRVNGIQWMAFNV